MERGGLFAGPVPTYGSNGRATDAGTWRQSVGAARVVKRDGRNMAACRSLASRGARAEHAASDPAVGRAAGRRENLRGQGAGRRGRSVGGRPALPTRRAGE